jgi:hypothetical protein
MTDVMSSDRFVDLLDRLGQKSVEDHRNPYLLFDWPDELPQEAPWMSDDLLTVYGTAVAEELDESTRFRLSKWESINFYSMNVHGIRDLLIEVVNRIHMPGFETPSDFFHHFIDEENQHMWFFAEFCLRYGKKLYSSPKLPSAGNEDVDVQNFLVFSRILLFEEIVDFYNVRMGDDARLHPTIRQVNALHHQDESRHIAFGRELVALLFQRVREQLDEEQLLQIEQYVKRYIVYSLQLFYSPQAYLDAGIADAFDFRSRVMADEGRRAIERRSIRKPMSFLLKQGILRDDVLPTPGRSR